MTAEQSSSTSDHVSETAIIHVPDKMVPSDLRRVIPAVATFYDIKSDVFGEKIGFNLPTVAICLSAISSKCKIDGWRVEDMVNAGELSKAALALTGTQNSADEIRAILNGATGPETKDLLESIIPKDGSEKEFFGWISHYLNPANISIRTLAHVVHPMITAGMVNSTLLNEFRVEYGFMKLVRVQQAILSSPDRVSATISLLNNGIPRDANLSRFTVGLDQSAVQNIIKPSFTSLADLTALNKFYNQLERLGNSKLRLAEKNMQAHTDSEYSKAWIGNLGVVLEGILAGTAGGAGNILVHGLADILRGAGYGTGIIVKGWEEMIANYQSARNGTPQTTSSYYAPTQHRSTSTQAASPHIEIEEVETIAISAKPTTSAGTHTTPSNDSSFIPPEPTYHPVGRSSNR